MEALGHGTKAEAGAHGSLEDDLLAALKVCWLFPYFSMLS